MTVSAACRSASMPIFGRLHAPVALEGERLGDDAHRQDAGRARGMRDHGCCTRSRAAAHAGGDEAHMRTCQVVHDLIDRFFGRRTADFRQRSGTQSLGHMRTELDAARRLGCRQHLGIRVGGDEIDAFQALVDHVVDRIAAAAAYADHRDPRPQSRNPALGVRHPILL